jgi:hypothetical protein
MPLTKLGTRVLSGFKKRYGDKKGEEVFYSAMNSGRISATKMEKPGGTIRKRQAAKKRRES